MYGANNYVVFTDTPLRFLSDSYRLERNHEFMSCADVAVDATGFVFVVGCINASKSLWIFNPKGQVIRTIELDRPMGVAIAPYGSVWVAGYGCNKLLKF